MKVWGSGWGSELWVRVSGFGFRVSGCGCQTKTHFRISDLGNQGAFSGFGFRVSGTKVRFRVSDFGFRGWGTKMH